MQVSSDFVWFFPTWIRIHITDFNIVGGVGDPIDPCCAKAGDLEWSDEDTTRVEQLRAWFHKHKKVGLAIAAIAIATIAIATIAIATIAIATIATATIATIAIATIAIATIAIATIAIIAIAKGLAYASFWPKALFQNVIFL